MFQVRPSLDWLNAFAISLSTALFASRSAFTEFCTFIPKSTSREMKLKHTSSALCNYSVSCVLKYTCNNAFDSRASFTVCVVDYRLRSLAIDSPYVYESVSSKLQLLLIESGSLVPVKESALKKVKKLCGKLIRSL